MKPELLIGIIPILLIILISGLVIYRQYAGQAHVVRRRAARRSSYPAVRKVKL